MEFSSVDTLLLYRQHTASPSLSLKSLTPKALKMGKNKQHNDSQQNDNLLNRRSLPGSRSIKEVVKDGVPRYVKADDVKRISQADKEIQQKEEGKKFVKIIYNEIML